MSDEIDNLVLSISSAMIAKRPEPDGHTARLPRVGADLQVGKVGNMRVVLLLPIGGGRLSLPADPEAVTIEPKSAPIKVVGIGWYGHFARLVLEIEEKP